eukprot:Gb_24156 [translate_table: standard]
MKISQYPFRIYALSDLTFVSALLVICTIFWCAKSQKVPAVLVFGDSYGDPGNNNNIPTLIKSNFPPYGRDFVDRKPTGRFCNGRILPDYFAEGLGIKDLVPAYLDPNLQDRDLLTGVSFASSGTGLDDLTARTLSVIPFWKQVEYFKEYRTRLAGLVGLEKATEILSEAIILVSIGTNDFIANYYLQPTRRLQFSVSGYQDFLLQTYSAYIEELYILDARKFGLINLPPLGCLPFERTLRVLQSKGKCAEDINEAASGFNTKLKTSIIDGPISALPGLKIVSLHYYDLVMEAIQNPSKYGFEVTGRACCGSGSVEFGYLCNEATPLTCADASKYVFFDSIHLTEKSYELISNLFLTGDILELL